MKTRSQINVAQSETTTTQSPNPVEPPLEKDDSELCSICYEPLESRKSIIIHKGVKWHHSLHVNCRDKWVNTCQQNNKSATCPLCPSFKIWEKSKYVRHAMEHLDIINHNNGNMPYIGIMIYMDGRCVLKVTNIDFRTDTPFIPDIPLRTLYEATRNMGPNVCREMGVFSAKNLAYNMNPLNWVHWKYPLLKVKKTYLAVPPCGLATNIDAYINLNRTLGELYVEYMSYIYAIYDTISSKYEPYEEIQNICNQITWHKMGAPNIKGYENPENPDFPVQYRAHASRPKSTIVPIAWIAIDTEYE